MSQIFANHANNRSEFWFTQKGTGTGFLCVQSPRCLQSNTFLYSHQLLLDVQIQWTCCCSSSLRKHHVAVSTATVVIDMTRRWDSSPNCKVRRIHARRCGYFWRTADDTTRRQRPVITDTDRLFDALRSVVINRL